MNENEEIWKPICGFEGLYEISNFGRIKSLNYNHTKKEKILSQIKNNKGYLYVDLYKNGKEKNCRVHRLVANAFIENPSNLPMVNHIDENKENNVVENLEWCDAKYNLTYGGCQQRRVTSTDYKAIGRKNSEKLSKQVYQYDLNRKLIKIWESTQECQRHGYSSGNISSCCSGKRKTHKGYIWSYVELKK